MKLDPLDDTATRFGTDRLVAQPLRDDDADDLFPVLNDERLHAYIGDRPPQSLERLRERYNFLSARRSPDGKQTWLNWVLRENPGGQAVGTLQATITDREADVAWVIGVPWQGRGYAKEAAQRLMHWLVHDLGIQRVTAKIHPDHAASARVAESAGLRLTDEIVEGERVWRLNAGVTRLG